ncbi:excisionase [Candidatus Pantoea multigeneris]|uniref:Excisionase n=1 Tax=Candidatus Pantoea multigeneris TaxID=2608357 RepID=A0ABX0R4H5_9GAMM|nr:excisionase [Pantoea multigeneris]NIF20296.1 excisionase [Pantoea multigeneris]
MAKLLDLQEWAALVYSQPPSLSTLRRWAREGRIYPCPELHGKKYQLVADAIYVDPRKSKMVRKTTSVSPPKKGSLVEKLKHVEQAGPLQR